MLNRKRNDVDNLRRNTYCPVYTISQEFDYLKISSTNAKPLLKQLHWLPVNHCTSSIQWCFLPLFVPRHITTCTFSNIISQHIIWRTAVHTEYCTTSQSHSKIILCSCICSNGTVCRLTRDTKTHYFRTTFNLHIVT